MKRKTKSISRISSESHMELYMKAEDIAEYLRGASNLSRISDIEIKIPASFFDKKWNRIKKEHRHYRTVLTEKDEIVNGLYHFTHHGSTEEKNLIIAALVDNNKLMVETFLLLPFLDIKTALDFYENEIDSRCSDIFYEMPPFDLQSGDSQHDSEDCNPVFKYKFHDCSYEIELVQGALTLYKLSRGNEDSELISKSEAMLEKLKLSVFEKRDCYMSLDDYIRAKIKEIDDGMPNRICPECQGKKTVFNSYDYRECEVCGGKGYLVGRRI
jgi:hypothetical protein